MKVELTSDQISLLSFSLGFTLGGMTKGEQENDQGYKDRTHRLFVQSSEIVGQFTKARDEDDARMATTQSAEQLATPAPAKKGKHE